MPNRKRNNQVVFRMSDDEYKQFLEKITKSNLKQNEYMIKCIISKKIIVIEGLKETLIELKRIGSNLNQISKNINGGFMQGAAKDISEIRKNISNLQGTIIAILERIK